MTYRFPIQTNRYNGKNNSEHYCYYESVDEFYSALPQQICYSNATSGTDGFYIDDTMEEYDKHSFKTLQSVWHIFWTIVPSLYCFALARLITQLFLPVVYINSSLRFIVEFFIIAVPTVLSVNVANGSVEYFVAALSISLLIFVWQKQCLTKAKQRQYNLGGRRPYMLTLARTTINYLTALCILAIDFENFPKKFRKSRRFGAGLMDVGIGLFVFSMGTVSKRPRRPNDLIRLMRTVAPILFLGLARTIVIIAIGYHQDEHEYGVHLNAFFTLGLTKLFATLLSAVATSDSQLLPLGLGVLALHEVVLQCGVSNFVMDMYLKRNSFLTANREGLCSLPGYVGVYLISMFIGQWLQNEATVSYTTFCRKLKSMTIVSLAIWMLVLNSIFIVGIARVTCNFGYAAWILAIAVTMTLLFMIVFDLILNTLWPVAIMQTFSYIDTMDGGDVEAINIQKTKDNTLQAMDDNRFLLPVVIESINYNGLVFFLVANILTGGVNMFLKPEDRNDTESIIILTLYMLIANGLVYILYRLKIRIA